jgi:hypothetical protein
LIEEALILSELSQFLERKNMTSKRARKGQALVLIVIVLLAIIVIFAVLSLRSARVSAAPTVQEVFWQVSGQNVTTVRVGDEVEAHVVVKATEEYVGSIVVKIRKDISFWPDSDYSIKTVPVNLRGGQETEFELTFVPDQASDGGFRGLRGYFVEVDFSATHTNWVMENSYPPRLKVT